MQLWGIDFGWKKLCVATRSNGWWKVFAMIVEEAEHEDECLKAHLDFWKSLTEKHLILPAFFVYEMPIPKVGSTAYRYICMAQGVWASILPYGCGYYGMYPSELKRLMGVQDRKELRKTFESQRKSITLYKYKTNGKLNRMVFVKSAAVDAVRKSRIQADVLDAIIAATVAVKLVGQRKQKGA